MKLLYLAFLYAEEKQIFAKIEQQFRVIKKLIPDSNCYIIGINSRKIKVDRYDLNFIDLTETIENPSRQDYFRACERIVLKLAPDIIYFRYPIFDFWTYEFVSKFNNIVFEHQTIAEYEFQSQLAETEKKFGPHVLSKTRGIVAVTEEILNYEKARSLVTKPGYVMANGIDKSLPMAKANYYPDEIHLCSTAYFSRWHGIDRLIKGMGHYKGSAKIKLHLIGHGQEIPRYQEMIKQYDLEKDVLLHGFLSQEQIGVIAERCQIGVGALGVHRKGLKQSVALKNREYCLRGIPFIYAGEDDDFSPDLPFIKVVPANDTPIDLQTIVDFCEQILEHPEIRNQERQYALGNLIWDKKIAGLVQFLTKLAQEPALNYSPTKVPKPPEHYVCMINQALKGQDVELADQISQTAISEYAFQPYLWVLRGRVLRRAGRYQEAISALEHSIESPEGLFELLYVYRLFNQPENADKTKQELVQKYPDWQEKVMRLLIDTEEKLKLRITYLISSILGVTGGNLTLLNQVNALSERGHHVTIVTYTAKPQWINIKARIIRVPQAQSMANYVPSSHVVISTYFTNTAELVNIDAPVKIYYAQGDQYIFEDDTPSTNPQVEQQRRRMRRLSKASYLYPDVHFVPNSRTLADAVERAHGKKPEGILPVCTDQRIFRPLQKPVIGSKCRILIVGPDSRGSSLEPLVFKGIDDIRKALEELSIRFKDFTAIRMSNTEPDIFKDFPCEFYICPSDELKTYLYGTAHILVYASHFDSCPRPPQEAMAAGTAVVCTATPGAMEYCRDDENCLLVPIKSPEAIADAVAHLIKDGSLRARLVKGGLATARHFPREREWNELEYLLCRFMEESGKTFECTKISLAKYDSDLYHNIQSLIDAGQSQEAIKALKKLLIFHPDFALAHNDLGVLYVNRDQKKKALSHYEQAVQLQPDNITFKKNLADFYCMELGRIEDALKIYVSILKTDPQDVETLMATGQICKALEKPDDALDFFTRVLEIEPLNTAAGVLLEELERPLTPADLINSESPEEIYRNLQSMLNNLSPDEVIGHLQKLMESFPDFPIVYNDLGVLYYNEGDKEKALKHYQKAVKLEPANTTFQKNLADYNFVELDRKEEALQIYLSLLNDHPNDLEMNLTAAHICVAVQNFSRAKELYKQVLVIDSENEDARNNLRTLDNIKGDLGVDQQPETESFQKNRSEEYPPAKKTISVKDSPGKDIPQFSIIMQTSAPLKQIRRCVESIKKHTSGSPEIVFVNNGTTKEVLKWIRRCIDENHNYRLVKTGKGAITAVCYNTGLRTARGEYVVLLSNDVIVTDGWLSSMLQCLSSIPNTGMVGTMANRARKRQKVATAVNPSFAEIDAFAETYRATNRYRRIECDILDGFCLLFRRNLLYKIGLFDEQMSALGFEDEDYCLRAALEGFVNQIAGDVYLHRVEHKEPVHSKKNFYLKWTGTDVQSATGKRHLALRAVEKAHRAGEEGKIDLAVDLFLQAIGLLPEHKESYYKLAEMLINTKRFQDALDVLKEFPEGDPDARHLELAACCKEGLEFLEEAQGYADKALEIDRCATSALNTKGIIAFRRDDKNAAESYFIRAMETDPGFGEAYTNLGALKWEAGFKEEALGLYERGFILSPTVSDIALNYHCALADLAEYQRAESVVRDAATVYPHNKKIRYMLIDLLIHQRKDGMAMKEIETAIADLGLDDGILPSALKIREKIGPLTLDKKTACDSTVSLCMIVKDEEDHLARCLQSVRPVVDEIIIVDTGSKDRSKDIARVFGAKVFDFKWTEHFAEARNYSLSKATAKMIFVMDADEVISPRDYELFRQTARQSSRQRSAFIINTRNYTMDNNLVEWVANEGYYDIEEAGTGWTPSAKIRLFPNDWHIRFDFPVHEMVEPALQKKGIPMKLGKFQVHHYGKLNNDKSEKKGEAYYEIGCKKLEEMGDSPIALMELAIQAEGLKKHQEAVELWERFIAIVPNEPKAYINMGISYCNLGQFDNVLVTAEKALKFAPDSKEGYYNCALAKLHLGHPNQAIEFLEKLCEEIPEYLPARFILAAAFCCREDKIRGMALLKELSGTAIGPGLAIRCHELAHRFVLLQRPAYALALLDAAIDSQNANKDVLDLYADCLKRTDFHKKTGTYE